VLTGSETTDLLRLRAAVGADLGELTRLPVRTRRAVEVAMEVGAPLVPSLDAVASAEDDRRRADRAVAVASAQTKAVAGGLVAAPLVLVPGLGRLVGADLVGFYTSGIGLAVAAVGLALLASGRP
jgi:Flp pilus assembly protein TadB